MPMPVPPLRATAALPAVALAATLLASPAVAQPRAQRVPDPGRSVASSDDSSALVVNPANLHFIPGAELRWNWVRTGDDAWSSARGHSIAFAGAFPFGLGTGLRMDFVRPPVANPDPSVPLDDNYSWLTWGLGIGGDAAALGMSISHLYSSETGVNGPTTLSFGWTARPSSWLGLAATAHDVNAPADDNGRGLIDRSYTLGAAVRPLGTRALEVGLEGRYFSGFDLRSGLVWKGEAWPIQDGWVPRATLGIDLPYVGRLRGDVQVHDVSGDDPTYVASAVLDINARHTVLSGGAMFGSALGGSQGAGFVVGAAITSWREPGIPEKAQALRIRIEETPSTREHTALLRSLWRLSENPEIAAIVFHIKTEPASSLAHADELDDAVQLLRARGKKVVCHLEDAGGRALHTCAHADRIVVNPAGGIRFAGLRIDRTFFAGLMRKLGVRAQFVRIGSHKSAPEQFTNTEPSDVARQDSKQNLDQIESDLVATIASGRQRTPEQVRASLQAGPFTAREALTHHLVDGFAYDDELRTVVSEVVGRPIGLRDDLPSVAPKRFGQQNKIAIVYVDGSIVDGRSQNIPLLGMRLAGSYTIAESLKQAREDPAIRAIVLRVESPGGSSMASDVMWREVAITAREKPVIVSMGGVAASGGYYVAAPGTKIYASPFTVTGSIGIFYGKADVAELLTKIGVNVATLKTAPHADAESIYRPFTEDEIKLLGGKVKQFYDVFIDRVARGREMDPAQVDAVARGRVWMGREAVRHRLVDEIGGLRQALETARREGALPDDAPIVELPPPEFSLLALAASMAGSRQQTTLDGVVPGQVGQLLRAVAPFVIYDPFQPLALCEITVVP